MNIAISKSWIARLAIQQLWNRGERFGCLRVWFVGDTWTEISNKKGDGRRLEMLFPHNGPFPVESLDEIAAELTPRIDAALHRYQAASSPRVTLFSETI